MLRALFISILTLSLLFPLPAEAHRMLIDEVSESRVSVIFEDQTPARGAEVRIYDRGGEKIMSGKADERGIFEFNPLLTPHEIVAQDDWGHRAVWEAEAEQDPITVLPLGLRIAIGLGFIAITSWVSIQFTKRKKTEG